MAPQMIRDGASVLVLLVTVLAFLLKMSKRIFTTCIIVTSLRCGNNR
jgi:hypothetical protein